MYPVSSCGYHSKRQMLTQGSRVCRSQPECIIGRFHQLQCLSKNPCNFSHDDDIFQTFNTHTTAFYNSSTFQEMAAQSASFLNSLPPYLNGRSVQLQNMVCCKPAVFHSCTDTSCCSGMYA